MSNLDTIKAKTEAIRRLLKANELDTSKISMEEVDKWEKRAGMTAVEKLDDLSKQTNPFATDKLQQRFSAIRAIKAIKGGIVVEVDSEDSRKAASESALRVLGPLADPEKIKLYIANHTNKTTLFSVKQFIRNMRLLTTMVAQHPEFFGESKGGSDVRDILSASVAAVKEARAYLKMHKDEMPPALYDILSQQNFKTDEKKDFTNYLGEGWQNAIKDTDRLVSAQKITGLIKV